MVHQLLYIALFILFLEMQEEGQQRTSYDDLREKKRVCDPSDYIL